MKPLAKLFEPGKIGRLQVKNRIVLPAMGSGTGSEKGGLVTDRTVAYYGERARGGVGLAVIGGTFAIRLDQKGALGAWDDSQIPGLAELAQAIQGYGARICFQLLDPGPRRGERVPGIEAVGPSQKRDWRTGAVTRPLTRDEIQQIVRAHAEAAGRARKAGFDAVEIHGAHGYLINSFMSPWTNTRTDEYGGSVENRTRFACEITRAVRGEVGPDYPVIFRMMGEEGVDAGITIEEAKQQAVLLVEAGADSLSVTAGIREALHKQFPTYIQESGCHTDLAAAIKSMVKVPVIVVGKLGDPHLAERILEEGKADFIAMGRALVADPDLPNKAREGRFDDIRSCIYCNLGCRDTRNQNPGNIVTCSVNPRCGYETAYPSEPPPAPHPKTVLVAGGGLAGMEAARNLAQRGHRVFLYEREDRLGGQWNIVAAYRPEVGGLITYLTRGMEKAGVKVVLNKAVDSQLVRELKPDAVVIATGAAQITPDIPGVQRSNVVLAGDVLLGRVKTGKNVVVIGGRLVGLDTATFLAEQGKRVSVIEKARIAEKVIPTLKLALMEKLVKHRVCLYPDTTPQLITAEGVHAVSGGEWMFVPADTVVLAVGSSSQNQLAAELKGIVPEVRTIGDGVEPRNSASAIHEGAKVGREL